MALCGTSIFRHSAVEEHAQLVQGANPPPVWREVSTMVLESGTMVPFWVHNYSSGRLTATTLQPGVLPGIRTPDLQFHGCGPAGLCPIRRRSAAMLHLGPIPTTYGAAA